MVFLLDYTSIDPVHEGNVVQKIMGQFYSVHCIHRKEMGNTFVSYWIAKLTFLVMEYFKY